MVISDDALTALTALLGPGAVRPCASGDPDPRTASHVSGLDVGLPLCWVQARDTQACADVVRLCDARGLRVVPIGHGTALWDPFRIDDAVLVDLTCVNPTVSIDARRRFAIAGAGASVGQVDRLARQNQLSLVAYPDSSPDTLVGSLLAVGTTAGLGICRTLPVEQICGATLVTGTGEVLRVGASQAVAGRPFLASGQPDLLGLVAGAQGEGALITEVALRLEPADALADVILEGPGDSLAEPQTTAALLGTARRGIDRHALDSLRIELNAEGRHAGRMEVLVRARAGGGDPGAIASALANPLVARGLRARPVLRETEAARRGEPPDYYDRYPISPGEHRAQLSGTALWGLEVTASWGDELGPVIREMLTVFRALEQVAPRHRRLGIYPARQCVSVGCQVIVDPGAEAADAVRAVLRSPMPDLLRLGAIPYRPGFLWDEAIRAHLASGNPAQSTLATVRAQLDPNGTIQPRRDK